jgi:hypothetical protein
VTRVTQTTLFGVPERTVSMRHADDFYPTPAWTTRLLLASPWGDSAPASGQILEPSCGDGALLDVLRDRWPGRATCGVEMDEDRAAAAAAKGHGVTVSNYFDHSISPRVSLVFGNPPFGLAQEFVEHSLAGLTHGWVTFLLRLGFLASQRREPLYSEESGFCRLDVLPCRPSFTGDGKTDQYDYGWFTWEKGYRGPATVSRLPLRVE